MDYIAIKDLEVFAHHGVYDFETKKGQTFLVNAKFFLDLQPAGCSDDLHLTINYGTLCQEISGFLQEHTYQLLEAAAENCIRYLLLKYPLIQKIQLELDKPQAPISLPFSSVSVRLERQWHKVYLALGSNMGDREGYLVNAIEGLKQISGVRVDGVAEFLETAPYGYTNQATFLNTCVKLETILEAHELLEHLQALEQAAGRTREIHWGPRTLDLDILFYDDLICDSATLTLPHPDLQNRNFVLGPLMELCPHLIHPVYRKSIKDLYLQLKKQETQL